MLGLGTLYYGVPVNIYQIGWNSFLVHHRSLPTGTTEIDGSAARLPAACTGLKTLEDHGAACLLAGVSPDPNEIAASLVRLISIGLLRAKPEGERPLIASSLSVPLMPVNTRVRSLMRGSPRWRIAHPLHAAITSASHVSIASFARMRIRPCSFRTRSAVHG
jgi:hypothetical protein